MFSSDSLTAQKATSCSGSGRKRLAGQEIKYVQADLRIPNDEFELSVVHEVAGRNQREHAQTRKGCLFLNSDDPEELLPHQRFGLQAVRIVSPLSDQKEQCDIQHEGGVFRGLAKIL